MFHPYPTHLYLSRVFAPRTVRIQTPHGTCGEVRVRRSAAGLRNGGICSYDDEFVFFARCRYENSAVRFIVQAVIRPRLCARHHLHCGRDLHPRKRGLPHDLHAAPCEQAVRPAVVPFESSGECFTCRRSVPPAVRALFEYSSTYVPEVRAEVCFA